MADRTRDERPLTFDEVARPTPAEKAVSQIRAWISSGRLMPGKRLPSERSLAAQLGLGRTMIRSALAELEAEGLVETRARRARIVADPREKDGRTLLGETVIVLVDKEPSGRVSGLDEPGWSHFVDRGVSDGILEAELNALTTTAARFGARELGQVLATPPRGVIVMCNPPGLASRAEVLEALHVGDIPVVALGDVHDWPGCDVVVSDHRAGSFALTSWLIQRGCRRILRCWDDNPQRRDWLRERDAGYEQACKQAGIEPLPVLVIPGLPGGGPSREHFELDSHTKAGYLAGYLQCEEPVEALMAVSDGIVRKLARASRILGKDPARDVAIVGYDNYWREVPGREFEPTPPLATVDKGNWEIGRALVEVLLDRIAGRLPPGPARRVVEPRLVVCGETETR